MTEARRSLLNEGGGPDDGVSRPVPTPAYRQTFRSHRPARHEKHRRAQAPDTKTPRGGGCPSGGKEGVNGLLNPVTAEAVTVGIIASEISGFVSVQRFEVKSDRGRALPCGC